jgi:hypothetical protein
MWILAQAQRSGRRWTDAKALSAFRISSFA